MNVIFLMIFMLLYFCLGTSILCVVVHADYIYQHLYCVLTSPIFAVHLIIK